MSASAGNITAIVTFANATMLAGLTAAVIPVAIHLLNRHQPRSVTFPTIRFLRAATASQSRVHRLRHLILMLLRCAFIALLAIAFARPVWFSSADAATNANRGTLAILLLDTSASMGYTQPPQSLMNEATAQAASILDALRPGRGDHANIIRVGATSETAYVKPTPDVATLRPHLERTRATAERAVLNPAIALAAEQFAGFRNSRRELHILSDFQRTNWTDVDFGPLPRDAQIVLHRVGASNERPNVAVVDLAAEPTRPVVGQPCRFVVRLANHSGSPAQRTVSLRVGSDGDWKRATVSMEPGRTASAGFDMRFNKPGIFEAVAEIEPDRLAVDDRRFAAVHVVSKMPIALCTDADLAAGATSSYFLSRALTPLPAERDPVELRVLRGEQLSAASLVGVDAVIVDASRRMTSAAIGTLDEFLRKGAGVVLILGPGASAENAMALQILTTERNTLPFEPAELTEPGAPQHVDLGLIEEHPVLKPFAGSPMRSLQNVNVYRHYRTRPARPGAEVIAKLATGDIALAAAPVGAGVLLLCNLSPEPGWSDLAKHAAFPGLLHQFVRFLRASERSDPPVYAGIAATRQWLIANPFHDVRITSPAGEPVRAAVRRDGPAGIVTFPPLPQLGLYRIHTADSLTESVAVNIDPAESNLASMTENELTARMRETTRATPTHATASREGKPLWAHVLAAAVCFLAFEMACLLFWRR